MATTLTAEAVAEMTSPDSQAIQHLRSRLAGALYEPGDAGYEEGRTIWNDMIEKRPALIAMCETTEDVVNSVDFARRHSLRLSIRGGGHNIAGMALCDGGLTINLSRMKAVDVQPDTGMVRVGPGATWGDVDRATEPFGLIVPGGLVSTTGVAGFTLGGGYGWLTRKYGYTADSLQAATVVLADGSVRHVSATSEPDLLIGLRGGGGNFGVATEFVFTSARLGPQLVAGIVLWPMDEAPQIIDLYREMAENAPVEVVHELVMRIAPPAPFLPETAHGQPVIGIAACFAGDVAAGVRYMQPLKDYGEPLADTIQPKPFREHQSFLDSGQPFGRRYYWKSLYTSDFEEGLKHALLTHGTTFSSPFSTILVGHVGGNARTMPPGGSSVGMRDAEYLVNCMASWEDASTDDEHIGWARKNFDAMTPYASGQYVNFMTQEKIIDPRRSAYDPEVYARLALIKARYDPENIFNLNKNIEPAIAGE